MSDPDTLHIYGQAFQHQPAAITGTSSALRRLRDAIDEALKNGTRPTLSMCTADGEEYEVAVIANEEPQNWALPYYDMPR
jgi:hypothetical protein